MQKTFAQRDLFDVSEFDDFLVDREKAFFEFEPIGEKAIFRARVIEFLAEIRDDGNSEKGKDVKKDTGRLRTSRK